MLAIALWPDALASAWSKFLQPRFGVVLFQLSVYPSKTKRLVKRLRIRDAFHSRCVLEKSQPDAFRLGVMSGEPTAPLPGCFERLWRNVAIGHAPRQGADCQLDRFEPSSRSPPASRKAASASRRRDSARRRMFMKAGSVRTLSNHGSRASAVKQKKPSSTARAKSNIPLSVLPKKMSCLAT